MANKFLSLCLLICSGVVAQPAPFVKYYGAPGANAKGAGCWQSPGGSIFVTGAIQPGLSGNDDIRLWKISSSGEVIWTMEYGTSLSDYPNSIFSFQDKLLIAGETTDLITTKKWGFVLLIDTFGEQILFDTTGFTGKNVQYSAAIMDSEGIYATGFISGSGIGNDIYVGKIHEDPAEEWNYIYETGLNEGANSLAFLKNGHLVIAADRQQPAGNYNVFVLGIDRNGNLDWELDVPAAFNGGCKEVICNAAGNAFIAGEMSTPMSPSFDMYLVEVTPSGEKMLETWIPATNHGDAAFGVCEPSPGNYILTGYGHNPENGQTDIPIVSVNVEGKEVRKKYYGEQNFDIGYDIWPSVYGGFIAVGTSHKQDSIAMALVYDQIELATTIEEKAKPWEPMYFVTKSGGKGYLHFKEPLFIKEFSLSDALGRTMNNINPMREMTLIELPSALPSGIYFVSFVAREGASRFGIFVP